MPKKCCQGHKTHSFDIYLLMLENIILIRENLNTLIYKWHT